MPSGGGTSTPGGVTGGPQSPVSWDGKPCSAGPNVAGETGNHHVTQTVTFFAGGCFSRNGDVSVGTPSLGLTFGTTIDAPEDIGGNLSGSGILAPQVSVGLGRFVGVGTFLTLTGPQGFVLSAGPAIGLPVSTAVTVHKGTGCGG